ncbi:MAG: DUF4012 domain-containing protein [Patescibacteria group bacterium]|nr:DUF4012 domain-containing protein [Patescibacteria group bacterium]
MKPISTQATNQSLKILLISGSNKLSDELRDFLQSKAINVFEVSIFDLLNNQKVLKKINKEEFYKIVWVCGFSDQQIEDYKLVGDILKNRKETKVIIGQLLTKIDNKTELHEWAAFAERKERLALYISKTFSKEKIIFVKNLCGYNNQTNFPIKSILREVTNNYLIDLKEPISLIGFEKFVDLVKKELFNPTKTKLIIEGKKIESDKICKQLKTLHSAYYRSNLKIKKINLHPIPLFFDLKKWKVKTIEEKVDKILDQQLRADQSLKTTAHSSKKYDDGVEKRNKKAFITQVVESKEEKNNATKNKSQHQFIRESIILMNKRKKEGGEEEKIKDDLKKIFDNKRVEKKTERRAKTVGIISQIQRKSKHKKMIFWLGLGVLLTGFLVGANLAILSVNYNKTKKQLIVLTEIFNSREKRDEVLLSNNLFFKKQLDLFDRFFDINIVKNSKKILTLTEKTKNVYKHVLKIDKIRKDIFLRLLGKKNEELSELISGFGQENSFLYQELSLLQAETNSIESNIFNPKQQKKVSNFKKDLIEYKKSVVKNKQIIPLLSPLLARGDQRTYLIVLQDNQELRPTGGFIQALAAITIEDGIIASQEVVSANEIDKQISGKIATSPEMNRLLGEENLYLRDANWDPDFPTTAEQITWFYQESHGRNVDGVIAINYFLIEDLLGEWGGLLVANYEEEISKNNLFEKLNIHVSEEKEQGLKENFQVSLFEAVLDKFIELNQEEITPTLEIIANSIKQKETLIAFNQESENDVFETLGWTGSIISPSCPAEFSQEGVCMVDSFYQVEANVSINKINTQVKRKITHEFEIIEDKEIKHQRKISYRNNSHSKFWPLGSYKFYLRIYLPTDAKLISIKSNEERLSEDKIATYVEHGKKVVGVLSDVAPQSKRELVIEYANPFKVLPGDSYLFFNQSQPGVKYESISLIARYSPTLSPSLVAPQAEVGDGLILFEQNLLDHVFAGIRF